MKVYRNVMIACVVILASLIVFLCCFYKYNLSPIDKKGEDITVVIEQGTSVNDILDILKEKDLIRSTFIVKVYLKLNAVENLKAGQYVFSQAMSVDDIVSSLEQGSIYGENQISLTFREGLTMRGIAKVISEKTNNSYDSVFALLKDQNYLKELANRYPFLEETINNKEIYYPLEGFLFPETYFFESKDVSVKTIFHTMLEQTNKIVSKYESDIKKSKYSIHELFTLASIIQSESSSVTDMKTVAGVFYNRLSQGDSLGSCVTSYYGAKKEMTDPLYQTEIDAHNAYNTRNGLLPGKLPVGPVSNPGEAAIKASIAPEKTDFYFFVSDKNLKLHFTKTNQEHVAKIQELKDLGLWLEW